WIMTAGTVVARTGHSGSRPLAASRQAARNLRACFPAALRKRQAPTVQERTRTLGRPRSFSPGRRDRRQPAGDVARLPAGQRLIPGVVVDTHAIVWYLAGDMRLGYRIGRSRRHNSRWRADLRSCDHSDRIVVSHREGPTTWRGSRTAF